MYAGDPAEATGGGRSLWARPLLLLVLTCIIVAGVSALRGPDGIGEGGQTYAGLFAKPQLVDLKTNGQDSVTGVFGGQIAPGDISHGTVQLSGNTLLFKHPYDLDFDVAFDTFIVGDGHEGHDADRPEREPERWGVDAVLARLVYGDDDLLAPPGRDLISEIDADPIRGNGDGLLSLEEAQSGANDLRPPGPKEGPTPFDIGIAIAPWAGNHLMHTGASITITFYLGGVQESDLN